MSRVAGRTDDMIVFQGTKVFPAQIFETVLGVAGIAPLCRIVLDRKDDADSMNVDISVTSDSDCVDDIKALQNLRRAVAQRIETALGICAGVAFVEEGRLRGELQEKKQPVVIDRRKP